MAVYDGNLDIVKALVSAGADVSPKDHHGWTALHEAADGGYKDIVQLLLDNKADVNAITSSKKTALHYAACGGHLVDHKVDIVKVLLDWGAKVDAVDEKGGT